MKTRKLRADLPELLREITELSRAECRAAWRKSCGTEPPKYLSVSFMQRVLAHDLQCRTLGGHPATARRALKSAPSGGAASDVVQSVSDGATLVREWNGRVYRVDVSPEGYVLDGKTHASLSSVARAHNWLDRIKRGETLDEIASAEQTTKKRVQQTIEYAFFAPDVVRDILAGQQPLGLTSTWVATHTIPSDWAKQRTLISTL